MKQTTRISKFFLVFGLVTNFIGVAHAQSTNANDEVAYGSFHGGGRVGVTRDGMVHGDIQTSVKFGFSLQTLLNATSETLGEGVLAINEMDRKYKQESEQRARQAQIETEIWERQQQQAQQNHKGQVETQQQARPVQAQRPGNASSSCQGIRCDLYIQINKRSQTISIYYLGKFVDSHPISTGKKDFDTPLIKGKPEKLFIKYNSPVYPEISYNNMGNMPYAIFLSHGITIHGTPYINQLGKPVSHGCIRVHPEVARKLNQIISQVGLKQTYFIITEEF